ncbi:STAS domain-containing protein [Alteribacillus sp. JSM 102045]|uniref:STAS domain-containing protein n=1 Tax=Alteribacillus sp. JSM 102045 TaxID=1562101 RepID=UPI0035BFD113
MAKTFGEPFSLLEIIEEQSRAKVEQMIHPDVEETSLEINIVTKTGDVLLADLYAGWNSELHGEVLVIKKDQAIMTVTSRLNSLRTRLQETNMEFFKEKERVEEVLAENNRLSAPFIEMTEEVALVPLFGDIDENKMTVMKDHILKSAHLDEMYIILIDFTAMGHIDRKGLTGFKNLFKSLQYMGKEVVVTGIHPKQAQRLHALDIQVEIKFIQSLQAAVKKFV